MKRLLISFALLCGCTGDTTPEPTPAETAQKVVDYGNGVYYFPFTHDKFATTLAYWRTGKRILAITADGTGGHGYDRGYYVITETAE